MAVTEIPLRPLGATGAMVSALGLGGHHIGKMKNQREAIRLIHAAIDAGITFMDNAWEYHDGRSEAVMGKAIRDRRDRVFLMTKVCTHGRGKREAMRQLEQSLRRLKTDHLDLWQVHECVYDNDPELHFANGGVIEALDRAKQQGKVRFVGFTGHKHPDIHLAMLKQDYIFDTCQLPLNCFDASFRSFEHHVLPVLERRGIAAIGMKSMGSDGRQVKDKVVTAEEALRYAMSLPVATTVSGIDSVKVLRQNLKVAQGFKPMSRRQMDALRKRVSREAADGRYELYKTTATHDGKVGRKQHGFPSDEELAA
jgi:aryl-alcohol dehydrogenase-like predicted oxidoreductase